jgi:mediator of RNA polymerase II transcription subunit 6
VIRKQDRIGPETATALVDFYILAGIVYQAPDLNSIIQSRVLNSALNLKTALEEFTAIATFNPSIGYAWKHQQEAQKPRTNSSPSKSRKSDRLIQAPNEFTRFQMKVNMLMKNLKDD